MRFKRKEERADQKSPPFFLLLVDHWNPRPQIICSILHHAFFQGKQLLYEDQIFTLPSSSAGGSFGKLHYASWIEANYVRSGKEIKRKAPNFGPIGAPTFNNNLWMFIMIMIIVSAVAIVGYILIKSKKKKELLY